MINNFKKFENLNQRLHYVGEVFGNILVDAFHMLALFAIGGTIVWAALLAFFGMVERGVASIDDILLLFIYLELGAMVGIYFKTNRMPVRFLIYVAMTALTRLMFGFITVEHEADMRILIVSGGILLLACAVLIIRIGSNKFPSMNTVTIDNPH
ncbi:MAG: phosphate-starvation-inducible PsiE family protein [Rhodospirillales bacterium]|nr:phosphate-starvation-inducible PsiE family protein [Rhodospirillales bacterium]